MQCRAQNLLAFLSLRYPWKTRCYIHLIDQSVTDGTQVCAFISSSVSPQHPLSSERNTDDRQRAMLSDHLQKAAMSVPGRAGLPCSFAWQVAFVKLHERCIPWQSQRRCQCSVVTLSPAAHVASAQKEATQRLVPNVGILCPLADQPQYGDLLFIQLNQHQHNMPWCPPRCSGWCPWLITKIAAQCFRKPLSYFLSLDHFCGLIFLLLYLI